jgi:hypothetical protein
MRDFSFALPFKAFFTVVLLGLAGCQAPSEPMPNYAAPSFSDKAPFRLNASDIRVVEVYEPPLTPPNVDHLSPVSPGNAMKRWISDRLVAAGTTGSVEVEILDASITETPLPVTSGVKGSFTNDQQLRYRGNLKVQIKYYSGNNALSEAQAEASATKSLTVAEDATVLDREKALVSISSELVRMIDRELEKQIPQYFSNYLNY